MQLLNMTNITTLKNKYFILLILTGINIVIILWYFPTILAILLVEETGIPMEKNTDQSQVTDKFYLK
jgi:hypothetical protein